MNIDDPFVCRMSHVFNGGEVMDGAMEFAVVFLFKTVVKPECVTSKRVFKKYMKGKLLHQHVL